MAYIFTQLPLVTATQPFVGGHGVFEIDKGKTEEGSQGRSFVFEINVECTSCPKDQPSLKRCLITIHILNVGDRSRYQDKCLIVASGLVVFGVTAQALSFHADANDVRVVQKAESSDKLGAISCAYVGGVRKYLERPAVAGIINGLLHVDISLGGDADNFETYALIKNIPKEKAASLRNRLQAGMIVEIHGRLTQMGFGKDDCAPVFTISSFRSYLGPTSKETTQETSSKSDPSQSLSSGEKGEPPQPLYLRGLETPSTAVVKRTWRARPLPIFTGKQGRREPVEKAQDVVMTDGQNGTSSSTGAGN